MQRQRSANLYAPTAIAYCTTTKEREKRMSDLPEYFIIANKIVERAERGLPQDRWMRGDSEQEALVRAYIALQKACINMHNDIIQRGTDAMDID